MTTEELRQIARDITFIPLEDLTEFVDILYDELELANEAEDFQEIYRILDEAGVNTDGLCRKKHPSSVG